MHEFVLNVEESPVAEVAEAPVEMRVRVDVYKSGQAGIAWWVVIHCVADIRFNFKKGGGRPDAYGCVLLLLALHL